VTLLDRFDQLWRVPALLVDGRIWLERLLEHAGRDDLRAYADAHDLGARMERAGQRTVLGYSVAAAILVAAALFYLFGRPVGPGG
jgi:hypothetical protein